MSGDVYQTRKKNLLLLVKNSPSRTEFADLIDSGYNNLNQYLAANKPKRIGSQFAEKVNEKLLLPHGWLDTPHDENEIKIIITRMFTTSTDVNIQKNQRNEDLTSSKNQSNLLKIIPLGKILKIVKGENLEVTDNLEVTKNIYAPAEIINPIAYLLKGTGYSKPYRNGYIFICEFSGKPAPGGETLIFTKDEKIYAGEFLYEQDILISIESADGEKINISKNDIDRISPIRAILLPDS
ncbi:hypothetical protein [Acinetobacter modestus]|uniref:hypothetical protein n=1 Tax=Acinetobacter modestus TaxID=1776740 RepID=UPI003018575E